jgi:hypothetical protein
MQDQRRAGGTEITLSTADRRSSGTRTSERRRRDAYTCSRARLPAHGRGRSALYVSVPGKEREIRAAREMSPISRRTLENGAAHTWLPKFSPVHRQALAPGRAHTSPVPTAGAFQGSLFLSVGSRCRYGFNWRTLNIGVHTGFRCCSMRGAFPRDRIIYRNAGILILKLEERCCLNSLLETETIQNITPHAVDPPVRLSIPC